MKKLLIISEGQNTGRRIAKQLNSLFGDYVNINNIPISEITSINLDANLILFTSEYLKRKAKNYIDSNIPQIVGKRIINHKNIRDIISIEEGKEVLFINDSYESAIEAVQQLVELGLDHIKYYHYYPGCVSYPKLDIAITPGESQLAPYKPKKIIDIGVRILDIKSIHEIGSILGLNKCIKNSLVTDYIRDIIKISRDIEESRKIAYESHQILETMVNSLDYGVGFIDDEGSIKIINSKFEYIFGLKRKDLIGKKLENLLPNNKVKLKDNGTVITSIENKDIITQFRQVSSNGKLGYIVIVKYNNDHSRMKIYSTRAYREYKRRNLLNFDDYLTINKDVIKMLNRAKKFAKSDGTVLITGENGTGKEILAQAIHINSYRSKNNFVPINIATLTPNLVESELFGYEEGTFTGAVKGGKDGIFEIANGGTIFIDEIGDIPLNVQTKLLRVLEEKRIRKIGSADEFPIDVRVIAATNKDLFKLVDEGKFRQDLFFRLNILPIETIPLRKRKEDIEYLLKYFININLLNMHIKSLDDFFEKETIEFLKHYEWPGNVRELLNLVEYLVLIYEGEKIELASLHSYMWKGKKDKRVILDENKLWILKQFDKYNQIPLGRKKLLEIAKYEGMDLGEGKIRSTLKYLKDNKFIKSYGNMGSKITELGKKALEQYK